MKDIVLKSLFIIPALFFVDYIIMIAIGCISCYLGSTSEFYECSFCNIGKFVLLASIIALIALLIPDVKALFSNHKTT